MRTVRKVARSRNLPRRGLAWCIVLALIALALAATRAAAHPCGSDAEPETDEPDEPDAAERGEPQADAEAERGEPQADAERGEPQADDEAEPGEPQADDAALLDALETEELARLDDGSADEDAIRTGLAFASATFDDASALRDFEERHRRPSRWGRVDLSVAWQRAIRTGGCDDALWLYATWRR